ncbi:hypothetical protein [Thermoflexus sp.]|uniref:hypothetical protein n=1 Tax=Thermoflexus sp. TaxID=1969742 RepID=UPI0035E41D20
MKREQVFEEIQTPAVGSDVTTVKGKGKMEAVGVEMMVTDDADAFQEVADALRLDHPVCRSCGQQNTERFVEE